MRQLSLNDAPALHALAALCLSDPSNPTNPGYGVTAEDVAKFLGESNHEGFYPSAEALRRLRIDGYVRPRLARFAGDSDRAPHTWTPHGARVAGRADATRDGGPARMTPHSCVSLRKATADGDDLVYVTETPSFVRSATDDALGRENGRDRQVGPLTRIVGVGASARATEFYTAAGNVVNVEECAAYRRRFDRLGL